MKNLSLVVIFSLCIAHTSCGQHGSHATIDNSATKKTVVIPDLGKVSTENKKQLTSLGVAYFALKDALVATDAQTTSDKAKNFLEVLKTVDFTKMSTKQQEFFTPFFVNIEEDAKHIISNVEIGHQRSHFNRLSNEMFATLKGFKANKATIYQQFCPMAFDDKGAFWLSDKKEIKNPYFGDKMLKCGKVTDTF